MAKENKEVVEKSEDEMMMEEFSNEIESTDYGFIFDHEGYLKAVYVPSRGYMELPSAVEKIFKLAGIDNPNTIEIHTIH